MGKCETCRSLLSEGLDLCVRARAMDAQDRTQATLDISGDPEEWMRFGTFEKYCEMHNEHFPHAPLTGRCGTPALWAQDQYDKDLLDWEVRSRKHLTDGCENGSVIPVRKIDFMKGRQGETE